MEILTSIDQSMVLNHQAGLKGFSFIIASATIISWLKGHDLKNVFLPPPRWNRLTVRRFAALMQTGQSR